MSYTNSKGDRIPFNTRSYGLHLDESELFDYFWTVSAAQGRITSIVREPHEIPVGILYLCDRIDAINEFDDCIDYDARVEKPGTLRLNGYSLTGVFCKSSPDDYQWKKGFDYQSECHCSKTKGSRICAPSWFDYQSECHCSKTHPCGPSSWAQFDYQSECHCSKTPVSSYQHA